MRQWENRTHKTCKRCGQEKPLEDFYKFKSGRWSPRCKPCHNKHVQERRVHTPERRERANAYKRKRYAEVEREGILARYHASFAADPEGWRARWRADYARNPDKFIAEAHKRRARLANVEHEPYTRREIWERDEGICKGCGLKLPFEAGSFHIDHVWPVSKDGPNVRSNLQLLCRKCNLEKRARTDWIPPKPTLF